MQKWGFFGKFFSFWMEKCGECATIKGEKAQKEGENKMNTALNVASYIVDAYGKKQRSITNLALQKVLYYAQIQSYQDNRCPAFSDEIEAWRHGPVVRDVYNTYRKYISSPIDAADAVVAANRVCLGEAVERAVDKVIEKAIAYTNAWDLVEKTHQTKPWRENYVPDESNLIPKRALQEGEVNL